MRYLRIIAIIVVAIIARRLSSDMTSQWIVYRGTISADDMQVLTTGTIEKNTTGMMIINNLFAVDHRTIVSSLSKKSWLLQIDSLSGHTLSHNYQDNKLISLIILLYDKKKLSFTNSGGDIWSGAWWLFSSSTVSTWYDSVDYFSGYLKDTSIAGETFFLNYQWSLSTRCIPWIDDFSIINRCYQDGALSISHEFSTHPLVLNYAWSYSTLPKTL